MTKKKGGRPSLYRPEYAVQGRKLALLGATDEELASFFEVSPATIDNWKATQPEFLGSLKDGKASADADIADRLHQRAMGFEFDKAVPIKVKEVTYKDGKRVKETERVEVVTVHEVVPPDTTACIFWLKNRKSAQWRDKVEHEHEQKGAFVHWIAQMPNVLGVEEWQGAARTTLLSKVHRNNGNGNGHG